MANRHPTSQRKSRQELERTGQFRKDLHADLRSPEPTQGTPDPPEPLGEAAQREWDRAVRSFLDMGAIHLVDAHVLFQYVQLWAEVEDIARQRGEHEAGIAVLQDNLHNRGTDPDDKLSRSDIVECFSQIVALSKLVSKCTDQLRGGRQALRLFLVEFGLTPSSRPRIKLPPKIEPVVDEFTAAQQRRMAGA